MILALHEWNTKGQGIPWPFVFLGGLTKAVLRWISHTS